MTDLITRFGPDGLGFSPFWIIGPIFWLLVLTGFIVLAIVLGRRFGRQAWLNGGPGAMRAAMSTEQVLGERYARGEIDESEYRQRLDVLRQNAPQPRK